MPILTHLGASFDSPEAFFLVICNIFINIRILEEVATGREGSNHAAESTRTGKQC